MAMGRRRICLAALSMLLLPGSGRGWGDDGHMLILESAVAALPDDARRVYEPVMDRLRTYAVEPDRHSIVPAEAGRHFIDIEELDPSFLAGLTGKLDKTGAARGLADEDARGIAISYEREFFARQPPPWNGSQTGPLWDKIPPDLPAFRSAYPGLETIVGTVVYQPYLYSRPLARAIRRGDQRWIMIYAGLLAHYTGDLFVPLHVTSDYKGQYSGNLIFDDARKGRGDVHARFETAFVKYRLEVLRGRVAETRRDPRIVPPSEITPRAVAEARGAYALAAPILEADRKAAASHDPARSWARYAEMAGPVFEPAAARQLGGAASMLADLFLTAVRSPLDVPSGSGKMGAQ
jgi:hypothetical protein